MRQRALTVRDLFFFALGAFSSSYLSLRAAPESSTPCSCKRDSFLDSSVILPTQDIAPSVQPSVPSVHDREHSSTADAKPTLTLPSTLVPSKALDSESLSAIKPPLLCPLPPPCPTLPLHLFNHSSAVTETDESKLEILPKSSLWLLIGVNTVARSGGEPYLAQVCFNSSRDENARFTIVVTPL
jgi:hypothetical protein